MIRGQKSVPKRSNAFPPMTTVAIISCDRKPTIGLQLGLDSSSKDCESNWSRRYPSSDSESLCSIPGADEDPEDEEDTEQAECFRLRYRRKVIILSMRDDSDKSRFIFHIIFVCTCYFLSRCVGDDPSECFRFFRPDSQGQRNGKESIWCHVDNSRDTFGIYYGLELFEQFSDSCRTEYSGKDCEKSLSDDWA